jgi:hypothetical protein
MAHNLEKDLNMKLILCIFEQLSELKINFDFLFRTSERHKRSIQGLVWL